MGLFDYWVFNSAWIPILFIIFLGVAFEIILVKTCEFFKKKLELWENGSLCSQKQDEDVFSKKMTFESWSISHTSPAERVETFSGRVTSSPPSEVNEDNTRERAFSSDECEYVGKHFCESHSSSGGANSSLSMFHSEVKKIFIESFHRKDPQSEYQTINFSSNNLFSLMKSNKTKNTFPDALSFQRTFKFIRDKDLNMTPCPPVHLFLSGEQIRHVEENVRRKIPVNPKVISGKESDCVHPRYQEPLIHHQHSNEVAISAEAQDTFPEQSVMQNQMIHETRFTTKTQQFIHNQEPVSSQPGFVQPLDFLRLPFSSRIQDSFQVQQVDHKDKSQHFIHIPCIAETEDSTKGIESDEHFSETQNSAYLNDQNKSKHLVKGQNSVFQNAEFLFLPSNSFSEARSQQKVTPDQQPIVPLESNQYYAFSLMSLSPTIKRQRNRRKIQERKLSLKVPSAKAKKISCSQVFPVVVCHTSKTRTEFRCKKKNTVHQRKMMSNKDLHLVSVSKHIALHVKKYFLKNLVAVILDLIKCERFLQGQNKLLDTEKINYMSSIARKGLGIIENREHITVPCSLFQSNRETKESSEDLFQQLYDLNLPKHERLSEVSSESLQKDVSFPQIESNREMKVQDIPSTENVGELKASTANTQRCFSKDSVQNANNSVEIILNFPGTNFLISLGSQKQEKDELKDINVQVIAGSTNMQGEKPLTANITEYVNPPNSEKLGFDTRSNKKNRRQDERVSDKSRNIMQATISEPFNVEICHKLKANTGTLTINCRYMSVKQENLQAEKKIQEVKHIDKSPILKKPREWDSEEEEKIRETVQSLAGDFRVSIYLKQKDKCAQFEMGQIHSGKRKIQSKEEVIQSQIISTQTVWEISPCPLTNPIQIDEVKQRIDKHTDKEEAAGPTHPPFIPENSPAGECLIEVTECKVPFCGKPTKTLDSHITENKDDLKNGACGAAMGPFKARKISRQKNVLSIKHKIIKVKKSAFCLRLSITASDTLNCRRKVGGSFKIIIKQMLHEVMLASGLLNVHPQRSSIHNNKKNIKITSQKIQVKKKEKNLDSLNKENKVVDPLEIQLCHGVKVVKQVLPERVAPVKKSFRVYSQPVKEIKMEKEMFQAMSFTETTGELVDSLRMDSFCVANTKNSTSTQTELQYCAELELGPPSGKLWMGDSLNQSRQSNVSDSGNDRREISCGFTQKTLSWSLNYCIPVLTHFKKKKDQTRFTNMSTVRLKNINKMKSPASKPFNITNNKNNSKLDRKTKLKRINQAKAFLPECQNTPGLSIYRRLQGVFCRAQLKQGALAKKICIDCVVDSSAFYNREKRLQEEKQNPSAQAAPHHGEHWWEDADQRKNTLLDEPDPSLISLSQKPSANSQGIKCQKDSLKSALEANLQMIPIQMDELQKITKTENDMNFPMVPKILSPKASNSSPDEFTNMTDGDLESEHELDLYQAKKDSETSTGLQVTFLQSSDSITRSFISRPTKKRKALRSKKQITVSQRRRTMREIKRSVSQNVNFRYRKNLKHNKEMKDLQQRGDIAGACLGIIHSNVYILPNKEIRNSKAWTDKQRIKRLGHMQQMQEKLPKGRNAHCRGSADLSDFSSMKNCDEEEEEPECFLISENNSSLIFDMYQEKDHDLVRSDKQLSQLGRTVTQVQPQTPTEVIPCSALYLIPDEFQLEKLEGCFSVYPLKFGEAKNNALSERENDLSDERSHKDQVADSKKEAKELLASYTNPNHCGKMKCDSTKMKDMYQEKKIANELSSLTNVVLDINMNSKLETEKNTPNKETPCSIQTKPEIMVYKGNVTSDDIKEIDLQDKEEKKNDDTLLKSFPQYSHHSVFYSHQSKDPNSHKLRGKDILFIVEQDILLQSQSAGLTQRECAMCTSCSKASPMQLRESKIDKVMTDRTKYDISDNDTHAQKLNSWDRLEREGLKNDLQATITEALNLSIPDVPTSKRKSKRSTYKNLQGKMCSAGVTMKGKKTSASKILSIPQFGYKNNLLPKTLKSQISELLIHSGILPDSLNIIILKDPTAEKNKLLTQELEATMLESLGFSTPTSRERENVKLMDKRNEMSNNPLTVKTRKVAISQALITAAFRTPKQGKCMAGSSLNSILSPMPVSLYLDTCDRIKDRNIMWTMRFSHELHDQSAHKERNWCTHFMDKDTTSNDMEDVKGQGEEDPLMFQHFSFSAHNRKKPNFVQSGLQLNYSATYPELERALYDEQAPPVNVNILQSSMVGVMSPVLNTEESEIGSIPCDNIWDGNPRRKCDYPIPEQKARTQKELVPLQEHSFVSSESKCECCTLEFSGKRYMSPKARQASRLLNIARHYTKVHKKKRFHNSKKVKCVEKTLLYAIEDAESCPLKFITNNSTNKLLLGTGPRAAFSSRKPQESMAEEKTKLQATLATDFLRPYNFFIPVLSDFKSQVNTKLSENKILMNKRFSIMKKKKPSTSKIIKTNEYFILNHKKKFKLRTKMKALWLSENITDILENNIHYILTCSKRNNTFKTEVGLGVSKFTLIQSTHRESLVEGIAEYDSIDKGGSNTSKKAKLHVGQCWGEEQDLLMESGPFYSKHLTVNTHFIKKLSIEQSEGILLREYLPKRSQIYEANPEINVKIEDNHMQVNFKDALSNIEKSHSCSEVSERTSNTTKHGIKKTVQSFLKEKSSFYLTGVANSVVRHLVASKEFKKQNHSTRVPDLSVHKDIPSQIKEATDSQSPPDEDHADVNINKTQDFRTLGIKVDNGEVSTNMKSIYMCIPIQHIKMESSYNIWDMYKKSTKENCLDKAKVKRKEIGQLPFGADQKKQTDPFKSEVLSTNTVHHKDIMLQKTAIYLIDQEGNTEVGEELSQEVVLSPDTHTLQIERQNNEFKTGWKTNSKSFALPKIQEKPNILGSTWSSDASDTTYPKTIREKDKAKTLNVKNTVCGTQIKQKAKKIPVPLLGREDRSNKKELGLSMQHQNTSELRRNAQNLAVKANFDLSPVKKFTSVKLEKDKLEERKNILPQIILEKPFNQRQMSWSGSHVNVSRKREENIREEHAHCTLNDIHQQFTQRCWVKSEEIKEHHSWQLENLQRKINSELTSQKDESDNLGTATSRSRGGTKVYIDPQDSLQQKCHLKQGTWRAGSILQPGKEFPHFGMTIESITKQDIKSDPQRIGRLKVMDNPLDPKESLLIPRLIVQQQNLCTDPLLESISSHVPHQLHTEEPEKNMKISDKILKNSTPQLKKISNAENISDMDYIPRSIEKLLLLIKEQKKRRKKSRGYKKIEISEGIKTTMKNPIQFLNYLQPRTQFINTINNTSMFKQRDETEPNRSVATLWRQQRMCVQGINLDYVYTSEITSKVIHQNKRRTASMESILYHKGIKKKVRKTTSGKLLNIIGYSTQYSRKELRHSIKTHKKLPQGKAVADLLWKDFYASGYIASQIKKLIDVKEGKGKQRRRYILPQLHLKKTLNKTKISVQPIDNNSVSSTIRKLTQYTIKQKEHQVVLVGITPQNKDQLMTSQQVEEPKHPNFNAHFEEEACHVLFPETGETEQSRLGAKRPTSDTEFEFSPAQRVKQEVMKDSIKHTLLVPPRRGGLEKVNISSSKGYNIFLMEMDTFQKKTSKVKELLEQENSSRAGSEAAAGRVRESLHLEKIKAAKEASMYHYIKNIFHLFELRKTDTELHPKAQAFLCKGLEDLHKTGTAQKGHSKSSYRPQIILNSVPCHKRALVHLKPSSSTTRKDSGDSAIGDKMNLRGEEKNKSSGRSLKLNRQKVETSKKSAKQLTIFTQNKEKILNFFLSCILHQLQAENKQKQISAKAVLDLQNSNPMVEKASSEVKILRDYSRSSRVNLHINRGSVQQESACEAVPMSNTPYLMDTQQITSPQVKKALKAVDNLDCHILNREKGEYNKIKEQSQYHLSFSPKNLEEHISCSQNYSYVQPHTKEILSKVGNVPSRTKGPDLSSKYQLSTLCECRQEWIFPSAIQEQTKEQNAELSFKSVNKTIKCPSCLSSKRKQLFERVQISKSVSNDSSCTPQVSKKELQHRASENKQEVCLPQLFLHCLSLCMKFFHENEKQKGKIEYGVRKDTICPERKALNSKKLVLPHISSTKCTPSNKEELQCYKKEKMIYIRHGKDKPGSVVIKACESILLPHFNLDKEKIDVFISSNVRQEKPKSQDKKNGIKAMEIKGIIDSNNTLKTEELLLSYPSSRKKLSLLFDSTKKQGKVQEELSKSDIKLMKSFISLPPLLHANLNSRTKIEKAKSRLLEGFLPPLKRLLGLKGRKVPFSKTFSGDNLCKLIKLKYLSQRKEYSNNMLDLKDIIGLTCIVQKGKKSPLKCLLQGKEQWWNNKVEKIIQGNEKNLNVVQNKPWDSIPSSLCLDPKIMEAYLQGITKFFLRSPSLSELPAAIGVYQETADGISSRIKKTKYISLKHRLQIAPKEVMRSRRLTLRQKLSSASQELQFNVGEKAKKMQEDKQIKNWNKPSISYLPYSEVDTRINGEETMQIRTQDSTHHLKLLSLPDVEKITYTKSNFESILNSVKYSMEYALQKEKSTKTEKTGNKALSQDLLSSPKEQWNIDPQNKEQERVDRKDKKQQNNNGSEDQKKMELNYTKQGKWSQDNKEQMKIDAEVKDQGEAGQNDQEQEDEYSEDGEQKTWNHKCDTQGNVNPNNTEPKTADKDGKSQEKVAPEYLPLKYSHEVDIRTEEGMQRTVKSGNSQLQHKETNEHYGSNTTDEHTNVNENLGHVQEIKCELGKGLTMAFLPHSMLDLEIKVKEEVWIKTGSFSQHSQSLESPDSEKLNYTASSLNDINDFKRSRDMSYKEENGENTLERITVHSKARHANINKSLLSYVPQIKRLQVNLEEQESSKEKVILLKKIHSVIPSSDASKLDKSEEVETEVMQSDVPYSMPQESLPVGHVASTKAIVNHSKKRKLHPPWEEEEIQTSAIDDLTHLNGPVFKAKTTTPPHVSSFDEHNILSKTNTHRWNSNKNIGQKHQRERHPNVVVTKSDTNFLMTSFIGELTHTGSNEGITLSNVIIKTNQQELYDKAKVSVTERDTKDRITWRARISPPQHLNERMPPFNIKDQKKEAEQDESEPIVTALKETAFLPSPSFLKSDTRLSEEDDMPTETQISFAPLEIQNVSLSEKRACTKSTSYVLNNRKEPKQEIEKNKLRKDVKDKNNPKSTVQMVKKLPLLHTLSIKELQRETQQEKLVDLANTFVELPISQLQLGKFLGAQIDDREVYNEIKLLKVHVPQEEKEGIKKHGGVMYVKDIYLKSPTLPMHNLSDCQWKTREQRKKVEGDESEPSVTITKKLTRTSTAISSQHSLTVNTGIREECTPLLRRSSVSMGYFQKASDSEGSSYIQPIPGNISISLQNEKQHMSEKKKEAGMQIAKIITTHKYQETKVQELKDEKSLVLTKFSPLLPDLPQPTLHEKIEFNDTKLRLRNSALQKLPTKEETVPREDIVGDIMKNVKKQHIPQREETYRKEIVDKRGTDITLKSRKSPLSQKLHRTELHMHINAPKPKEQDNKSETRVLRKMYISKPFPTNITVCRGIQVDEKTLESKLSSPILQKIPVLSDAENMANKETMHGCVRKGKQYTKQTEKAVDLATEVHYKNTKVSSISHLLNTKEFVLNMKVLQKKMHKDKGELAVVAKRSFLSVPSSPSRYSQDKTQNCTASLTGHYYLQKKFQEPADAQETSTTESAEVNSIGIVKTIEYNMLHKQARLQKSKSVISTNQISENSEVEPECESAPADHKFDLTRLDTIKSENMLRMSFKGQKGQPEKCEKESSTKIGNWKKENEIKDNLSHKTTHKFPVLSPKKSLKKALITSDTFICSKGSVTEREQETCSCKSDKPPKQKQSNAIMSKLLTPENISPEKLKTAHSGKSQNKEEQNVNIKEQAMPHSKSAQQIKPKSFPLLNVPIHSKTHRMPLQTDVDKKTAMNISPQIQSGLHRSTTEFNAKRREEDSPPIALEQEQCYLALPQKSHDSLLKSEHLEDRDEMNTVSDVSLKQKKIEIEKTCTMSQKEGKLETDSNRGIDLEEVKREMQKSYTVNLENKARKNISSITSHTLSPEESEIKTQVVTSKENYTFQEKLKKELELPTAKQNLQGQNLLHKNILNSVYAYVPICPQSQKSKFTITSLKRELKPKYLTMRIPKHTILKILGIVRYGSLINKRKLEYAFNKPKTMVSSSKDVSGIVIRRICVSMTSPSHTEGTVESKTNPERKKRVCHSKFQEKLPDTRDIKDILTIVKELNFTIPLLQGSQPFMVNDGEMWKLSDVEPQVTLECELDKNLCLQTREGVVAGSEDLNITHKPDMNTTEQGEIQKDTITSPECTFEDKNDTIETHVTLSTNVSPPGLHPLPGTPLFDKMRKYPLLSKQGEAVPGTVSITLKEKNNENKTHVEFLFPIYEALKCIFEAPVENMIQNQIVSYKLGELGAYKPNNAKASFLSGSPGTSSKIDAILLHTPLLKQLNPELKNKLSMHLISKATEIKLNQIPEMVNISLQKCNSHHQRSILEDYSYKIYLNHMKMNTIHDNLSNYQSDFPPLSCGKTPTMSVSSSSKITTESKQESIKKQESITSLKTWSDLPLSHILHKLSKKEKNNLLQHFCAKTMEIQTTNLPRIAAQSYAMANAQNKSKPLFQCIHSATTGPKQTNRILILFDEKSFCEIDHDLQCKYLRSISRPSVTLVSKPNVLPKHTSKLIMDSGSESIKVTDSEESNTLSFNKEDVSFQNKNLQESSLLTRKLQEPTNVPSFHPGLQGTEQNDMIILSNLKLQMTNNSEDKQCHLWFQESNSYKQSVLGTQQNTTNLASSHSSWISDDWINDVPLNTKISTDLAKCPGPEDSDSDECVFIETNFYLAQDSQKFLCEVPKGIPLADIHKMDKATFLKPFYCEAPNDYHTRTHRKHTSPVAQPCDQSLNSRKHKPKSKMQSPVWLSHSSSNTMEIESTSSSITFNEMKHWTTTTWSRTSYSLTSSTTESNTKLNLIKKHGKSHMYSQGKERRKAKSDLWRKFNVDQCSNYSHSLSEEKHTRRKRLYQYELKEPNPQTNQMPEPNAYWQNIKFYSERRENQPFFYACIPADSMDIIPQTIRWVIPHKILQKRNFQVPRVAKISKSWNL